MQQGGGRPTGDTAVAIGGTGDDALEETEDAAHGRHIVERGDEMHLRGPRVGEADVDARIDQRREEGTGAVHDAAPVRVTPSNRSGPRIPAGSKARLMERMSSSDTGSSISRK